MGSRLVALCALVLLATSCSGTAAPVMGSATTDAAGRDTGQPLAVTSASVEAAVEAGARLKMLRVEDRVHPSDDYRREAFGSAWSDIDGNGCNQRDDVLLRDGTPGTVRVERQGACDHDVLAGEWLDPYTGQTLRFDNLKDLSQAQALQIDHVVPLAEAWVSGAALWADTRRREFANDLGELLAVDGPTNAGKGDSDPAAWRPKKAFQCAYAIRWVVIKAHWDLAIDPSERRALEEMLSFCGA